MGFAGGLAEKHFAAMIGSLTVGGRLATLIFDPTVRRHIQRRGDPEEMLEADSQRTTCQAFVEIEVAPIAKAARPAVGRLERSIQTLPLHSQVPFPQAMGGVTGLLQELGEGLLLGCDQGWAEAIEDSIFQTGSPAVLARQQGIACRGTDSGRGVGIRETQPMPGQSIDGGGRDLRIRVIAGDIAEPQIIGQHDQDVGQAGLG